MPREHPLAASGESAEGFASDLARLGISCGVDVRDAVALLVPADDHSADRFADPEVRQAAIEIGRARGFVRVALIIGDR
jgi:hypothetical protein